MYNPATPVHKSILILGASFATGNLGVSALAWSSMYLIRSKWPKAQISILGADRQFSEVQVRLDGPVEDFQCWPVRYCPNIFVQNHIFNLYGHCLSFIIIYLLFFYQIIFRLHILMLVRLLESIMMNLRQLFGYPLMHHFP